MILLTADEISPSSFPETSRPPSVAPTVTQKDPSRSSTLPSSKLRLRVASVLRVVLSFSLSLLF